MLVLTLISLGFGSLFLSFSDPFEFRMVSQPSIFLSFFVSYLELVVD